ncbi:MAG: hypothetical protein U0903_13200 [Planctomycetales bacterium]
MCRRIQAPNGEVLAVDSHARAFQCTETAAQLNGLTKSALSLNATGEWGEEGVSTPRSAILPFITPTIRSPRSFCRGPLRSLKVGGEVPIVTKFPIWYRADAHGTLPTSARKPASTIPFSGRDEGETAEGPKSGPRKRLRRW